MYVRSSARRCMCALVQQYCSVKVGEKDRALCLLGVVKTTRWFCFADQASKAHLPAPALREFHPLSELLIAYTST